MSVGTGKHPNAELLAAGYAAFGRGDMAALKDYFAEDVMWHQPGRNTLSGDYRGLDAVLGLFGRTFEETQGTFRSTPYEIVAGDEYAVALVDVSGERKGRSLRDQQAHVVRVRDGRVVESWIKVGDPYGADDFWS